MSAELDPMWVGVAGVISAVSSFLVGQRQGKAEFITAVTKASDIVISRLQKECDRMEVARQKCEDGHDHCKEEVQALKDQVQTLLMTGPVATYTPSDLTRVGDKT